MEGLGACDDLCRGGCGRPVADELWTLTAGRCLLCLQVPGDFRPELPRSAQRRLARTLAARRQGDDMERLIPGIGRPRAFPRPAPEGPHHG